MEPVIQQDPTGCAIASTAAIAGVSYMQAKRVANGLGIQVQDSRLWSETTPIRDLISEFGLECAEGETPFVDWVSLPDLALLATKWHFERRRPCWHWMVFVREGGVSYVLDSKQALRTHKRTDFGRIKPRWFIEVTRRSRVQAGAC